MVLAESPHRSLLQEYPPEIRDYLRFFGTVCSVRTVARVGTVLEDGVVHLWVQLSDDDEDGQNVIYDALRRYRASPSEKKMSLDLHVVFADEDASAFPPHTEIDFARE
jgi:hypothetical protein